MPCPPRPDAVGTRGRRRRSRRCRTCTGPGASREGPSGSLAGAYLERRLLVPSDAQGAEALIDELLSEWEARRWPAGSSESDWTADAAIVLPRSDEKRSTSKEQSRRESLTLARATVAYVSGDLLAAAEIYGEIGAVPTRPTRGCGLPRTSCMKDAAPRRTPSSSVHSRSGAPSARPRTFGKARRSSPRAPDGRLRQCGAENGPKLASRHLRGGARRRGRAPAKSARSSRCSSPTSSGSRPAPSRWTRRTSARFSAVSRAAAQRSSSVEADRREVHRRRGDGALRGADRARGRPGACGSRRARDPGLDSGGGDLQVRVAVTTGEALVALGARPTEGEGMASGDVVNTGARLQAAAPVNGILVDETTYRSTHSPSRMRPVSPSRRRASHSRFRCGRRWRLVRGSASTSPERAARPSSGARARWGSFATRSSARGRSARQL